VGLMIDLLDLIVEGGIAFLLNFGKLIVLLDLLGEIGLVINDFFGLLNNFDFCKFPFIDGKEWLSSGFGIFRLGVSVIAGFSSFEFPRECFRTGFFSVGFLGTRFLNFGFKTVSSFFSVGFSKFELDLLILVGLEGTFEKVTPILALIGGGDSSKKSDITPKVNPSIR